MNDKHVYVVQEVRGRDITAAREYGRIIPIFLQSDRVTSDNSTHLLQYARDRVSDIVDGDYLLLIGDPCLIGIVSIAVSETVGKVCLLRWDKLLNNGQGGYIEVELDLTAIDGGRSQDLNTSPTGEKGAVLDDVGTGGRTHRARSGGGRGTDRGRRSRANHGSTDGLRVGVRRVESRTG